jgi:histidyl-tRNA synthetase
LQSLDHAAEIAAGEDPAQKRRALNTAILGRLLEFVGDNELGASGVDELRAIMNYAESEGIGSRLEIDPSLARGLSYYTGAIMEINVRDLPGSLGGGGRYDNLVGMFLGDDVPACGFSLGLERIIVVMTERQMFPEALVSSPADVMVSALGEDFVPEALGLARDLREGSLRVSLYPEPTDKLQKQLSFADRQNIPIVALIGEHESKNGTVFVKQMRERSQEWVTREVACDVVQAMFEDAKRGVEIDKMRQ